MRKETITSFIFPVFGCGTVTLLGQSEKCTYYWNHSPGALQVVLLLSAHFIFGFLLVLVSGQTRNGYAIVTPFLASFFFYPACILFFAILFPPLFLVYSLAGMTNFFAVLGGVLARLVNSRFSPQVRNVGSVG